MKPSIDGEVLIDPLIRPIMEAETEFPPEFS